MHERPPENNENNLYQRGIEKILMILELENPTEKLNSQDAIKLIDSGYTKELFENIYKFETLSSDVAIKLIDAGKAPDVAYYFSTGGSQDYFTPDIKLAEKLIEKKEFYAVLNSFDQFSSIDKDKLIDCMIESGEGKNLSERIQITDDNGNLTRIDNFDSIKPDTVEFLLKCGGKEDNQYVYKLRDKFSLKEIAENYDLFRIKSWEDEGVLQEEDKKSFNELKDFMDEKTLSKLWSKDKKEELHIIAPQIIRMYNKTKIFSGLHYSSDTFRGEYLERIINDNKNYNRVIEEGWEGLELPSASALKYFNDIVRSLEDIRLVAVLNDGRAFEQTREFTDKLAKENPYKSWETLKKLYELAELLKSKVVLEKLQKLKDDGKQKQYDFFSKLAFHPGSKIPMQTVFQFMENPASFLDVGDEHSGEAHERKKPSNYTQFDYLDISAEDLRDALIEGALDKLQYFKPFEAQYSIPNSEYLSEVLKMELDEALGSFQKKIKGTAKNPGKLFQMTQQVLKKYGKEYKDLARDLPFMTNEMKNDLEQVLFNKDFGIKDSRKFNDYLVKIHPKSAPEGHLAGNDTACCMPFGSGKNNVYMYNLGCSILTVQRKVGDKYRTIAQSVLTPDVDIHHNISELVRQVQSEALLSNVITDDLTQNKKIILTADNIEVAPNADSYKRVIEEIYTDFISKYVHEINSPDLETGRMLIGKGYSDLNFSRAENIENTFIPITPVAYSDNYGDQVYELPLSEKSKIIPLPKYGALEKSEKQINDPNLPKGVSYLTAHDTLRVSYMEGKVYAENESLVQYIHRIGNELSAKDINNGFKNRPNLSLKIEDEKGAMLGYMIAYEGAEKSYDHGDIDDETKVSIGEKVIYISDLAADTTKSKLAGGKLINAFGDLINREYLQKGNPLAIVAQARENTSYKIIQKHLSELGRQYGYRFELEENGSYESGGENMYQIKLKPVKI